MGTVPLHPLSAGRSSHAFSGDETHSPQPGWSGDLSPGCCFSVKEPGSNTAAAGTLPLGLHVNLIVSSSVCCILLVSVSLICPQVHQTLAFFGLGQMLQNTGIACNLASLLLVCLSVSIIKVIMHSSVELFSSCGSFAHFISECCTYKS